MTDPALPRTPPPAGGSWRRPAPWIGWLTKALLFALLLHGLLYGGAVWTVDRLARILPSPAPGPARAQVRAELLAKPLLPALAAGLEQIGERALALDDLAHQPLACTPFHAAVRVGWSVRSGCFVDPRSGRLFVDMRQLEELLQACAPYGKTAGWYAVGFALAERLQLVGRAPAFRAPPEPEDADQRRLWAGRLLLQREQIAGYLIAPLVEPGAAEFRSELDRTEPADVSRRGSAGTLAGAGLGSGGNAADQRDLRSGPRRTLRAVRAPGTPGQPAPVPGDRGQPGRDRGHPA